MYPKNRYLTLQFSRGGKNVMCEDCFDNMVGLFAFPFFPPFFFGIFVSFLSKIRQKSSDSVQVGLD